MTLTVHLGAHKTASTHLQLALAEARGGLMGAGVWYAGPGETRGGAFPLLEALGRGAPDAAERAGAVIAGAVACWPELLISDENLLGGTGRVTLVGRAGALYPRAGRRVARLAALTGRPLTLALSVREPGGFLSSAFGMQLAYGNEWRAADYLGALVPDAPMWSGLASRLLAVPGVAGLIAWRYEDYRALRPALLRRLLPAAAAAAVGDPPVLNVGMTARAHAEVAQALADDPGLSTDRRRLASVARRAKARHPAGPGQQAMTVLDEATRARTRAAYVADIEVLARLPGVELLRP